MQRRTKFQILVAYYSVAVIIGILIAMLSTPICLQQRCVEKSAFILSKMETDVDPCKDFYKFMCGSARKVPPKGAPNTTAQTIKPDDPLHSESIFKYMVKKVMNYAGATRTGAISSTDALYHESLLSKFFTMCERVEKTTDQATVEDVKSKLQVIVHGTGMSVRDLFNSKYFNKSFSAGGFEYRSRISGFPGRHFFTSEIKRDHLDPDNLALYIGRAESFLGISAADVGTKTKDDWFDIFKSLGKSFVPSLEDKDISNTTLKQVINLWFDMKDIVETVEDKKVKEEAVRVAELQKRFPNLDFVDFLNHMGASDKNKRHIYVNSNSKNYFTKLSGVLKKYSRQDLVVYLFFQCLWDVTPFISFNDYMTAILSGIASLNSQSETCKKFLGNRFGGMVLSLVIERFELQRNPPDILDNVFFNFIDVMKNWLMKTSWMDSSTKTKGTAKLQAMKTQISLSKRQYDSIKTPGKRAKFYNGLCMQRSVLQTLLCMNRFFARKNFGLFRREITGFDEADAVAMGDINYNQEKNLFQVPIFILRFPAFDDNWPLHVNFGGIGTEIGAEITSGFDLGGSERDKFGIEHLWWTNKTLENYKKKELDCSKTMQPLEKKSKAKSKGSNPTNETQNDLRSGELTQIYWKDLMGLKMSYKAYMDYRDKQSYRGKFLPGLEMYTREQNYFLSHAHMRCLPPMAPEELVMNTTIYFHAISSLKEFKEAFECSSKQGDRKAATVSKAVGKCTLF